MLDLLLGPGGCRSEPVKVTSLREFVLEWWWLQNWVLLYVREISNNSGWSKINAYISIILKNSGVGSPRQMWQLPWS